MFPLTQRLRDTETQRYRDTEIQRHRDTEIQRQRHRVFPLTGDRAAQQRGKCAWDPRFISVLKKKKKFNLMLILSLRPGYPLTTSTQ